MQLLRVLKATYELFDATDVARLAKSSIRNPLAFIQATRMLDSAGELVEDAPVFLGSGFTPTADGTSPSVALAPGVCLFRDSSEADIWLGEVKVCFNDSGDSIALGTNNDVSGDDRIDVISLRPVEVEEDPETRWFKDPVSQTTYQQQSKQRTRLDYEIVVTAGTPAPSPTAPATPAGTYKVAEVLRTNGQVNVLSTDVTDSRTLDRIRTGILDTEAGVVVRSSAVVFGDPDGNHYKIARDSDVSPTELRVTNQVGGPATLFASHLSVGASGDVSTNDIRAAANTGGEGIVDLFDDDASAYGVLVSKNTPLAWGSFLFSGGTWVLQSGYNLGGTVTDAGTGDFNVQFDVDVLSSSGAAIATFYSAGGPPLHVEANISDFSGTDRLVIETYDLAGTPTDPTSGDRVHVLCFTLPTP